MRKIALLFICMVTLSMVTVFASDSPRYVEVEGYNIMSPVGELADYYDNLYFTIYEDSAGRAENPNTIYVLKRNCIYPLGKQISNYDFHLQIMGEAGEGYLPEIIGSPKSDGTYGLDFIKAYNDFTLKNLYINGTLPSSYQHWQVEMRGNGSGNTYTFDNVALVYDRAASLCVRGDSLTVNVKNSVFGNTGSNNAGNGNGRLIDIRTEAPYVKSLTVENCITFNHSDRIMRHMAGEIGYLKIDRLTAVNTLGMNGGLQLGNVREAHVTNNIFANVLCLGQQESRNAEQQQADKTFAVITLDTNYVANGQIIDIQSNNIYWDNIIKNQAWALFNDVSQPNYICATTTAALGANASAAYFTEPLSFGKVSSTQDIAVWVASYHSDPTSESLPDSWTIPGANGNGGLYYDEFDVTYSGTSVSATAATDGGAVGCAPLDFSAGISLGIDEPAINPKDYQLRFFPNPVVDFAELSFVLDASSQVDVKLYTMDGKLCKSVFSSKLHAGEHSVSIDTRDMSTGMYMYSVITEKGSVSKMFVVD